MVFLCITVFKCLSLLWEYKLSMDRYVCAKYLKGNAVYIVYCYIYFRLIRIKNMATFHTNGEDAQLLSDAQSSRKKIEHFISKLQKDDEETRMLIMLECQLMKQKIDDLESKAIGNLKSVFDFYTQKSKNSLERCNEAIRNLQNGCLNKTMETEISLIKGFVNDELCLTSLQDDNLFSFHVDQSLKDYINNATYLGDIKLNMSAKQTNDAFGVTDNMSTGVVNKECNFTLGTKSDQPFSYLEDDSHDAHGVEFDSCQTESKTTGHSESEFPSSPAISTSSATNQVEVTLPSGPPKKAVYEISFVAKSVTDKSDCHFNGACFLADRRLILADQRNQKLKLFAVSLQLEVEIDLGSKPFDVVETSNGEVAVTMPDKHHVWFYDNSLKYLDSVDTEQPCLGISATKENLFVLCESTDSKPCCINVYNNSKQIVSKMTKGGFGKPLLKGSEYVSVCESTETVYFARRTFEECKIFSIDVTGNVNWKSDVSSADISEASFSLAAVEGGVVIAADCVRCISHKGKTKKKLMSPREKGLPYAIAVNPDRTMMLVTYFAPEFGDSKTNNFVNLYRLLY